MKLKLDKNNISMLILITAVTKVYGSFSIIIELITVGFMLLQYSNRHGFIINVKENGFYFKWIALFLGISILSITWCPDAIPVLYGCRGIIECLLVGSAVFVFIKGSKEVWYFLKILILAAIILLFRIVLTTPLDEILLRNLSGDINANVTGIEFVIAVLSALWLFIEKHLSFRKLFFIVVIMSLGIIFSGSRKAIVALVVGLALMRIFYSKNLFSTIRHIIIAVAGIALAYYLIMNVEALYLLVGKRIEGMITAFTLGKDYGDASTFIRLNVAEYAITMWKQKPILGYGMNSFVYITPFNIYTHNNYIELLFGVGIIGTLIYYSIYIWMLIKSFLCVKTYRLSSLFISVIITFLICDIGFVSFGDGLIQMMIAFICAGIARQYDQSLYRQRGRDRK